MIILRNLYSFNVPVEELVNVYCSYIRSVAEQFCVVWASSITKGEDYDLGKNSKGRTMYNSERRLSVLCRCPLSHSPYHTQSKKAATDGKICSKVHQKPSNKEHVSTKPK